MADTILLAGLALGFMGMLAYLEDRDRRRRARHDRTIARILDREPGAQPRAFTAQEKAFCAKPPKSSDLLPWR